MSRKNEHAKLTSTRLWAGIIAGFLACLMFLSVLVGAFTGSAVTQKEVDAIKAQLNEATAKRKEAQAKLDEISGQKAGLVERIQTIDDQMAAAEAEIELQEKLIAEYEVLIAEKEVELENSRQKELQQQDEMREYLRFMVENGNLCYLEVLFSADDFSDFLTRYEIITQVTEYEQKLYEELKEIKEEVNAQKIALEEERTAHEVLLAETQANIAALAAELEERNAMMLELEAKGEAAQAEFSDIAAQEDELEAEMKKLSAQLAEEARKAAEEAKKKNQQNKKKYVGGTFLWPLPASYTYISSYYGMRTHPVTKIYKLHTGIDIPAGTGTSIYAANAGTVIKSTYSTAYGNYVVVDHGGGITTLYAHMSKRLVSVGDYVSKGETIGKVGSTGYSTGPHLHFEILKNGNYTDPLKEFKLK